MLPHDYTVSDAPSQGRAQGESVGKRRRNGEISLPPSSPGSGMRVFHLSVASRSLRNDPLGGARSFLYNKGEPQGGGAPHPSRIMRGRGTKPPDRIRASQYSDAVSRFVCADPTRVAAKSSAFPTSFQRGFHAPCRRFQRRFHACHIPIQRRSNAEAADNMRSKG